MCSEQSAHVIAVSAAGEDIEKPPRSARQIEDMRTRAAMVDEARRMLRTSRRSRQPSPNRVGYFSATSS